MKKNIRVGSLSVFNPADFLNDWADRKGYIEIVKEEADPVALSEALSMVFLALGLDVRQKETLPHIHNEEDFSHIVFLMNELVAVVADNEEHPLASLLDRVSDVVSRYESVRQKI